MGIGGREVTFQIQILAMKYFGWSTLVLGNTTSALGNTTLVSGNATSEFGNTFLVSGNATCELGMRIPELPHGFENELRPMSPFDSV